MKTRCESETRSNETRHDSQRGYEGERRARGKKGRLLQKIAEFGDVDVLSGFIEPGSQNFVGIRRLFIAL